MRKLLLGAAAALLLTVPATASAATTNVRVGLGDQSYTMFDQQPFQALNLKLTRYFIKWNAAKDPYQLQQADIFVDQARKQGIKVHMIPSSSNLTRKRAGSPPSVATYRREVGKLVRRYRAMGVTEWGAWNEANHDSQPTYRNAARAAAYFRTMYGMCRGCTIVALDVLDQSGVEGYVARFYGALSRTWDRRARIVGIHNYSDVNRLRARGTADIIRTVKRRNRNAKFWLTETGGVVEFGRAFPCNERRAANRIGYMFRLARQFQRSGVQRLYAFSYWGNDCKERFDAGLVDADGTTRPGYTTFRNNLRNFRK